MADKYTYQELAAKIKKKYPQYEDMDDSVLVDKIVSKHPQYGEMLKKKENGNVPSESSEEATTTGEDNVSFQGEAVESTPDYMGLFDKKEQVEKSQSLGVSLDFYNKVNDSASKAERPINYLADVRDLTRRIESLPEYFPELKQEVDALKSELDGVNSQNIDALKSAVGTLENKAYSEKRISDFGEKTDVVVPDLEWREYERNVLNKPESVAIKQLIEDTERTRSAAATEGLGALAKGTGEGIKEWFEGWTEFTEQIRGNQAVAKLEKKLAANEDDPEFFQTLTTDERLLAKAIQENFQTRVDLAENIPTTYKIGEATGQSLGFMAEFAATMGAGGGLAASIRGLGTTGARKIAANGLAKLAQAGIQTAAMPSLYKNTAIDVSKGESFADALLDNYWELSAETLSERLFLANPGSVQGLNAADRVFRRMGVNLSTKKGFTGVAKNILEENVEEKISEIFTAPKDYKDFSSFWRGFTDKEQNLVTLGSVSLMVGLPGSLTVSADKVGRVRDKVKMQRLENMLEADLRQEVDVVVGDKDLSVKEMYDLIGKNIQDRVDSESLGEEPNEVAANMMRYAHLKIKDTVQETAEKENWAEQREVPIEEAELTEDQVREQEMKSTEDIVNQKIEQDETEVREAEQGGKETVTEGVKETGEPEQAEGDAVAEVSEDISVGVDNIHKVSEGEQSSFFERIENEDSSLLEAGIRYSPTSKESKDNSKKRDNLRKERDAALTKLFELSEPDAMADEVHDAVLDELETDGISMPDGYTATVIDNYYEPVMRKWHTVVRVSSDKSSDYYLDVPLYRGADIGTKFTEGGVIKPTPTTSKEKADKKAPVQPQASNVDAVDERISDETKTHKASDLIVGDRTLGDIIKEKTDNSNIAFEYYDRVWRDIRDAVRALGTEIVDEADVIDTDIGGVENTEELLFSMGLAKDINDVNKRQKVDDIFDSLRNNYEEEGFFEDKPFKELFEEIYDNRYNLAHITIDDIKSQLGLPTQPKTTPGGTTVQPTQESPSDGVKQPTEERKKRIAEIDAELGEEWNNLMQSIGGVKNVVGDQKQTILKTIPKIVKLHAEKLALQGQELVDAVKQYFKDKNIELDDELTKKIEEDVQALEPKKAEKKKEPKKSDKAKDGEKADSRLGVRFAFGDTFSEEAKKRYRDEGLYEYKPESQEQVAEMAKTIFKMNTLDVSERLFKNEKVPKRVRLAIGLILSDHYANLANVAAREGNNTEADFRNEQVTETFEYIQKELAIEAGRDVAFFASEFVKEFLTPYGFARKTQKAFEEQRESIFTSKTFKKTVSDFEKDVLDARDKAFKEVNKDKRVKKAKEKYGKQKKEVDPKIQKIRDKRASLREQLKNASRGSLSSSAIGLNSEQIEIGGEIALTYLQEGVYNVKQIINKLKKEFKLAGVNITDEQAREMLPKEHNGKGLEELEKEQAMEQAATALARQEFGYVIDKKAPKSDPMRQMVNTLVAKFRERTKKGDAAAPKSNLDVVKEAILNKKDYMDVWKEARDKALDTILKDEKLSDSQKMKYSKKINDAYDKATTFSVSEKRVQQLIRESFRDRDISIDDVLRDHYERRNLYKNDLIDDLKEKAGLTGEAAKELADIVDNAFNTLLTQKADALLDRYVKNKKTKDKIKRTRKQPIQELLELVNIGAFESEEFREVFGEVYGVPKLTEEQKNEIVRQGKFIQKIKASVAKNKAQQRLLGYVMNLDGVNWAEFMTGMWYAQVLSGVTTHMRNISDANLGTWMEMLHLAGWNMGDAKRAVEAWNRSKGQAWTSLVEIMTTGVSSLGKRYVEIPSTLERSIISTDSKQTDVKALAKVLDGYRKMLRYVTRFLIGMDNFTYVTAKEMAVAIITSQDARRELEILKGRKLTSEEKASLDNVRTQMLALGEQDKKQITDQVEQESKEFAETQQEFGEQPREMKIGKKKVTQYGYTPREKILRRAELRDEKLGLDLVEEAHSLVGRSLGNIEMYGTLGYTIDAFSNFFRGVADIPITLPKITRQGGSVKVVADKTTTKRIKPFSLIMPFTRVVSNVATRNLGWTNIGAFKRAATKSFGTFYKGTRNERFYREMTEHEKRRIWQKLAKVAVFHALGYALMSAQDDDDPWFEITLNGTGDWQKNKQLEKRGWRPYSIRFGAQSVDYRTLGPLSALLLTLGYMNDKKRYQDYKGNDLVLYAQSSLMTIPLIIQTTPIYSVTKAFEFFSYAFRGQADASAKKIAEIAGAMGTGFVSPRTLKDLTDAFDILAEDVGIGSSNMPKSETPMGKVLQYIPGLADVASKGRLRIDVFGEPIKKNFTTQQFVRIVKKDPLAQYYMNQGYLRPIPNMNTQEFTLKDERGQTVKRNLNPLDKKEVAMFNSFDIMIGQSFKRQVEELKANGYEGEEFVDTMESAWRKIVDDARHHIEAMSNEDPVKYDKNATVIE